MNRPVFPGDLVGRPTIAVDFDGVLSAQGLRPFVAEHAGEAVPGAIPWLRSLLTWADVAIMTSRALHAGGTEAVREFLRREGIDPATVTITASKVAALVYVDDRGWRFEGRFPTREELTQRTWEGR